MRPQLDEEVRKLSKNRKAKSQEDSQLSVLLAGLTDTEGC